MSSSADKSSGSQPLIVGQIVIYAGIIWAVLALLYFLLFSVSVPGENSRFWYQLGTYIFEEVAFLGAVILCLRNWRSPQIASGRNVWLGIGLGMLSFFIANLFLGWWELYWDQDPEVSPGDLFFVLTYMFLGWGMILAVIPRRLNLEMKQWAVVAAIAAVGIALAVWITLLPSPAAQEQAKAVKPPAAERVYPATPSKTLAAIKNTPAAAKGTAKILVSQASAKPSPSKTPIADAAAKKLPPEWVISLENQLKPLATPLNLFYVVCDIFLLIIAATLLLAFWGGRFSQSWRMIAAAAFSFYIADVWFKYATSYFGDEYQSGSLPEVFWVFSGVLFAIGAALEYDTSSRSSRRGGRKRA